jgi:hypothetical protein
MTLTRFLIVFVFLIGCSDDNGQINVQDSGSDVTAQVEVGNHDSRVVDARTNEVNNRDTDVQDGNLNDVRDTEEEIIDDLPSAILVDACRNHPAWEKRCPEEKCKPAMDTGYTPGCIGLTHKHYYHCFPASAEEETKWKLVCLCMCGPPED